MQLTRIALAAVALAAAGSVNAQVVTLNGASAFSINQVKALKTKCPGTFTLYKNTSTTGTLPNFFTATCSTPFTYNDGTSEVSTGFTEVRMNVADGSYGAVTHRDGNTGATTAQYIDATAGTCTSATPFAGTGTFLGINFVNCPTNVNALAIGGFLDVEGSVFTGIGSVPIPPEVQAADFVPSSLLQAFGVAVSADLYRSLMAYQVATGKLPAACASTSLSGSTTTFTALTTSDANYSLPLCQPNLAKAEVTALMDGGYNDQKHYGANGLVGGTDTVASGGLPANTAYAPALALGSSIKFCRRVETSGTNASMQVHFLGNPIASGDFGGRLSIVGTGANNVLEPIGPRFSVNAGGGTGDVRTCLNSGPAFGILSLENNPIDGANSYRYVKISNAFGFDGVAGGASTAEAIAGRYDFAMEASIYCPGAAGDEAACSPILRSINQGVVVGTPSPGTYLKTEAKFVKNGNNLSPLTSKARDLP